MRLANRVLPALAVINVSLRVQDTGCASGVKPICLRIGMEKTDWKKRNT